MNIMNGIFLNRREAGKKLASKLIAYSNHSQAIVLGLPRGGVPVAYEIATILNLPLDICLVKKLSLPEYPETAIGAIVEDTLIRDRGQKIILLEKELTNQNNDLREQIQEIAAQVQAELNWREDRYRDYRPSLQLPDQVVIIVDDGIATGFTMLAAVKAIKQHQPQAIIIATPIASEQSIQALAPVVDKIVCLKIPETFRAVGGWYEDFAQVSDQEVCDLLARKTTGLVGQE